MQQPIVSSSMDFIAAFSQQRQRLLHHAGSLLSPPQPAPAPDDISRLTQCLAASLEELKVAEEELFDQQMRREAAQQEQDRRLQFYRALFHHAPTPLFLTTTDGSIRAVNRAGSDLVMRDGYRLEGKPLTALVPQASRAEFRRQLSLLVLAGGVTNWCFTLLRHADIPLRVEATVTLLSPEITGARALYWRLTPVADPAAAELAPRP